MIFEHISHQLPVESFKTQKQTPRLKPIGFWLSRPGEWSTFVGDTSPPFKCRMQIPEEVICSFPWSSPIQPTNRIIQVDISKSLELSLFIERYQFPGYSYEIDWRKVQDDYIGIYFTGLSRLPSNYYQEYNNSDGCWILSIDVDSICVWDKHVLNVSRKTWILN